MARHNIRLESGDIVRGKYEIVHEIGSGGMSVVYLAKELANEKQLWAIKVADMENKISKRLFSEAKILSELDHPSLPQIADFFSSSDSQYFFLVMEYVNGKSLYEIFEHNQKYLDQSTIIEIGIQICDVLHYLHTLHPAPVVYRDLKPANIMIAGDGQIKLIDFGIARRFVHDQVKDTLQIGTVGFAAPEQFERKQSDTRTDLFSLGALLYYLLTGGKYVYITQEPVQVYRKSISRKLRKCVQLLVEKSPEKRIQSAEEVKQYLMMAQEEIAKTAKAPFRKINVRIHYVVSILVFIGVIVYIILDQL
ncbi:serine/threonine protein kinase [Lederbergia sp. NSJ-179]|uniref:serine/threonine protein kinase n=1 Tax=Lederbergia sp. NSJ-179 TaxID=2931402 RepID=UPI001FD3EF1A|nr:serine/threonine-protein kinase [Lederbergia sp. NSJ-179]MCJ7840236.1 serine/threonine protein kinase [Lederbergia sp. NSJ-179]